MHSINIHRVGMKNILKKQVKAFSLVEIAIALAIIGVLIGAALKGQELLVSARLKSVITQINQYKLATNAFMDRYGSLPGDYDKASTYIKAGLKDGNNNGTIEGLGLGAGSGAFGHEAMSFWSHLDAAGFISGSKDPIPETKIGGKITITNSPITDLVGHWFIVGNKNGNKNDGALFTPTQALSLAKKMDTEDPFSGAVQFRNGNGTQQGSTCIKSGNILNTSNKNAACVLYVKM